MTSNSPIRLGYKASAEQFGPSELLSFSLLAERLGFDDVAVSDHFQPWRHEGGHSPAVLPWLGALGGRSERIADGHERADADVPLPPRRDRAGVRDARLPVRRVASSSASAPASRSTRRPIAAGEWPGRQGAPACAWRRRSASSGSCGARSAWTSRASTTRRDKATIYDRPDEPVPIYIAASGPLAAKLAGRAGDGFICTSGKDPDLYRDAARRGRRGRREGRARRDRRSRT